MRKLLARLETEGAAVHAFRYRNTSSWVRIKSVIQSLLSNSGEMPLNARNTLGSKGLILFCMSAGNYVRGLRGLRSLRGQRGKSVIYVGAGSGLFAYGGEVKDSYFPYADLSPDECLYWLSADYPEKLMRYRDYLARNEAVIFSYIVAPLSALFARFVRLKPSNFDEAAAGRIADEVRKSGHALADETIARNHALFIARYWIFRLLLPKRAIKKAYIVSAYSYSEICAVLKERGVEIVELQHGLIGPEHRGYNYAVRDERLPTPDSVDVYNDFWKQELVDAGYYPPDRIRTTGRLKYELIRRDLRFERRFVVFTGQGILIDEIIRFLDEGARLVADGRIDLDLLYLPHPNEGKPDIDRMRAALRSRANVKIGHPGDATTEECIYHSAAHVSVYSSCHFDALFFKNKSYVFDVMENNPMEYYMEKYPGKFVGIRGLADMAGDIA